MAHCIDWRGASCHENVTCAVFPCGTFLPAPVSNQPGRFPMAMSLGKAEINVTPLIDVLLVLIIIFMVVLPQHSAGLPAVVPQPAISDAESVPNDQDIVVSVNKDRAIFAARATRVIFVRGHRDLVFQEIATVIDLAKGAD